jgi:oxygen-independent coproporphyrinogen-3 oxidase
VWDAHRIFWTQARLQPYQQAGPITITTEGILVSATGRLFVRGVGLVFDKYLRQPTTSSYPKLI